VSVAVYLLGHLFNDHFYSLLSLTISICFDLFIHVSSFIVEIDCTDLQTVDVWNTISWINPIIQITFGLKHDFRNPDYLPRELSDQCFLLTCFSNTVFTYKKNSLTFLPTCPPQFLPNRIWTKMLTDPGWLCNARSNENWCMIQDGGSRLNNNKVTLKTKFFSPFFAFHSFYAYNHIIGW